jgi:CsoR family transcriptional regulator, copper-sensing transcriptional repressor
VSEDPSTDAVADDGDGSVDRAEGHRPADRDKGDGSVDRTGDDGPVDRADRWQDRLAVPVIVAALASVPAIFLTLFDDPYETVGSTVNMISGGVLIAEAVVLFAVSQNRLAWLRRNLWLVALALVMIPAVVFAVGPVQLLRLLRVAGALRIIRVRRIFKAGKILRRRAGLNRWWQRVVGFLITALVAAFVGMLLADPSSQSRQVLDEGIDRFGLPGVLVAGLLLAGATWIVLRNRDDGESADGGESDDGTVASDWEAVDGAPDASAPSGGSERPPMRGHRGPG